jgi:hypothetical protein
MAGFFMRGRMSGMDLDTIATFAAGPPVTDSRFGHFPTPFTRDYDVSFLWVLFIMLMVIAVALYILSVMDKRPPE